MPVSYDHIGRDIIIVAVMFLLVFVVFYFCAGFCAFLGKVLLVGGCGDVASELTSIIYHFQFKNNHKKHGCRMVSQESNVYLVKTTYIINPVTKSCDGNNGFILILNIVQNNQLDCLKKQMSTYHLFFITYQLFICTLFDYLISPAVYK